MRLHLIGPRDALRGDAFEMARRFDGPVREMTPDAVESNAPHHRCHVRCGSVTPADGASPPRWPTAANAARAPVLAIDVPAASTVRPASQAARHRGRPHHHVLPPQAGPSPDAGTRAVREVTTVSIGIPAEVLSDIAPKAWVSAGPLASCHTLAEARRAQIRPRPRGCGVRSRQSDRRGPPWRPRRACASTPASSRSRSPPEALAVNASHLAAIMLQAVPRRARARGASGGPAQERRADRSRRRRRRGNGRRGWRRARNPAPP